MKGININNIEFKMLQYADNTSAMLDRRKASQSENINNIEFKMSQYADDTSAMLDGT